MAASPTAAITSSEALGAGASASATPAPVSVFYITVKPLTDTFTPPASCGEMHLTQLSSPGYQIWLNEPQPVTQSHFGDCYPPGYIDGYTSVCDISNSTVSLHVPQGLCCSMIIAGGPAVINASSSIAPMFSPLVCPESWTTARTWANGYIACCASDFLFHPPETTIDENRPAYGGTCYSSFQAGQTVKVTAYDNASVTATADWVASGTTDQAYAHPIDGFQVASVVSSPSSSHLSGGAIAGAVIGSIAGLLLILLAVLFVARRRQQRKNQAESFDNKDGNDGNDGNGQFQQQQQTEWTKELPTSPSTGYVQSPHYTTTGTFDPRDSPYAAAPRYELATQEPGELDSGWAGRELESGNENR
ncbi:hypothetical protein F4818DRAFT_455676 [Hypoxylon cercidicola]|nr:hypothetical protein F4818DRAFT_455676 [Hypoxylon cercidicola]